MMVIIIPTLLEQDIHRCVDSIYSNVNRPINVHLSVGYNNFSKSCNAGFNTIRSEWVLFLNDDVMISNNFIECMLKTADSLNADIVGAKLLYPNGNIQHMGVYFNDSGMPYHVNRDKPDEYVEDKLLDVVTGACIMVKSNIFNNLGGFDEGYINCFEDVDFCLKAGDGGYKVALCGSTDIIHYEKSTRKFDADEFKNNKNRLIDKWGKYIKYSYTVR